MVFASVEVKCQQNGPERGQSRPLWRLCDGVRVFRSAPLRRAACAGFAVVSCFTETLKPGP